MIEGFGELFRQLSFSKIGTSAIQSRAMAALINTTYVFAYLDQKVHAKMVGIKILQYQLDIDTAPATLLR